MGERNTGEKERERYRGEREGDMGERESERERQDRKKKISNTKKFMEFYLVVLQSGYPVYIHLVCVHLKINVVPLLCMLYNVHCL